MFLLFLFINLVFSQQLTKEELQNIFGSKKCIQGSLANINVAEENIFSVRDAKTDYQTLMANVTQLEKEIEKDNPILSKLNEFAQYNELDYYYKLEKEEGPPHDRIFTVSLVIGEEKYIGQGKSIKKAQKHAASLLFENTNYVAIPSKDKFENVDDSLTPTVLLNNVCAKLGIKVEYSVLDKDYEVLQSNVIVNDKSKKSYLERLNNSVNSNNHFKKDLPNTKGPFHIKLQLGENVFYGSAHSIQAAKHNAASNAIDFLLENKDILETECLNEGSEDCKNKRNSIKSPISLAYEAAQIRNMHLECEVINESGLPHRRTFSTQCQLGELITVGEGRSKKESKKVAAENILQRIHELPPVSAEKQMKNWANKKKSKKNKKKRMVKTTFEEISLLAKKSVSSILGYGNEGESKNTPKTDDINKSGKNKKTPKHETRSFRDEVLNLSVLLNFKFNYQDFSEGDTRFSLLSLHFNPEYLCLGEGLTQNESRDRAAKGALDLLYKLDFKNHFEEKYFSLESHIKASVQSVLRAEALEEAT